MGILLNGTLGMMNTRQLATWLDMAIPEWAVTVVENLVEIPGGWESDVYRFDLRHGPDGLLERLVLRCYVRSGIAEREYTGMRWLWEAGYPVPEVLAVDPDGTAVGRPCMVMRFIPSASDRSWPDVLEPAVFPQFVDLLRQLHALDWSGFGDITGGMPSGDPIRSTLKEWRGILARFGPGGFDPVMRWLVDHAADVPRAWTSVVHWDFHVGNVIVSDDGTQTVIDWTQIAVTDPRFDLAWTELLIVMALGENYRTRLIDEYGPESGLEGMDYFRVAVAFKRLVSVTLALSVGPEHLGMRPEAAGRMEREADTLQIPYATVVATTGLAIPRVEQLLERF